jgi:hypothetical protein
MKVKEYICIIEECGGMMRITGQFKVPAKENSKKIKSEIIAGRALTSAKPGEIVMVRI